MANDDYRKGHPEFTETDPPTRGKKMQGVVIPPLKPPPEPEPEPPKEELPPMPPKVEPMIVERGTSPAQAAPHDPWVGRITAVAALVAAVSAGGYGGFKATERDMPSSKEAKELRHALNSCESAVVKLTKKVEDGEARDKEQVDTNKLQAKQIQVHAYAMWFLNGQVAPVYGWPEPPRLGEWTVGTDNFHKINRRGGAYPGSE